jgi:hypothetical protein
MRKVISKVYQFDELSDTAKETARDWFRSCIGEDTNWAESVIEDASRIATIMGIDLHTRPVELMGGGTRQEPNIYWSIGNRSDDGVTFEGSYHYRKGSVKALEQECPSAYQGKPQESNVEVNRIARGLAKIQRRNFYRVQALIRHGRSLYAGIQVDVERSDDNDRLSSTDAEATEEALKDFAAWIHGQLEQEWEYQNSEATVDENIRANEYEFDEEGNRV